MDGPAADLPQKMDSARQGVFFIDVEGAKDNHRVVNYEDQVCIISNLPKISNLKWFEFFFINSLARNLEFNWEQNNEIWSNLPRITLIPRICQQTSRKENK